MGKVAGYKCIGSIWQVQWQDWRKVAIKELTHLVDYIVDSKLTKREGQSMLLVAVLSLNLQLLCSCILGREIKETSLFTHT